MRSMLLMAAVAAMTFSAHLAEAAPSAAVKAAVADAGRPEADVQRDPDRKPAEMLDFAGIKPGDKVADYLAGGGYFTRLFAKTVGPQGKVYAIAPPPAPNAAAPTPLQTLASDAKYGNIQLVEGLGDFKLPEPVDVVWTSQNYHDLFGPFARANNVDPAATTRLIYDSLKPGGVFIVLDHATKAGTPIDPEDKLHRIDPAEVRKRVEAAGFRFEGESTALRNPADDHIKPVFDPSIRGKTDRFIYKFRKPK